MFRLNQITGVVSFLVLSILILTGRPVMGAQPVAVDLPLAAPMAVVFSPDGKQIAVGGQDTNVDEVNDCLVLLIDSENGEHQKELRHSGKLTRSLQMPNPIRDLAYSRDGKVLAVASALGLKLWDPAHGKELATLAGYGINDQQSREEIISIAFSPDGKWLAASNNWSRGQPRQVRGRLRLWDLAQREVAGEFEIGFRGHVAFLPDGTMLVTDKDNSPAVNWRVADGEQLAVVRVALQPLFVIDRQGKHAVADSMAGKKLWRIEPNDLGGLRFVDEMSFKGERWGSAVQGVAFSPDGRLLLTFSRNGAASIYDVQAHQVIGTLLAGGPSAFSPDGTSIAVAHGSAQRSPEGRQLRGTRLAIWRTADLLDADNLAERARAAATSLVQDLSTFQDLWTMHAGAATMDMLRHGYTPRSGPWMGRNATVTVLAGPQGAAATQILIDALKNPRVYDKQRLLHPLSLIACRDSKARTAVIEALRTAEAADVRTMAATMLALLPADVGQEVVPALVEAVVNDECPHVRYAAERTLKESDPKAYERATAQARSRRPVLDSVEQRNGKLIYQGRSLEEWLGRLSASYLPNEIFGRPTPDEPLAAIRAIGPDAVPLLVDTLKRSEQPIRRAAAAGLGTLGPQAVSAVEPLLNVIAEAKVTDVSFAGGVPGGVASEAADAVALILKDQQEPPARLLELTSSDNPAARLSAARAIAVMAPEHPRGLPVLKAAFVAVSAQDGTPEMLMMERFIGRPSVGWLRRVIADDDADAKYRIQAAASLALLGEAALPALPEMLIAVATADGNISQQAVRAIHKIGPQAVPAVLGALHASPDDRTRQNLAAALCGLGDGGRSSLEEFLQGMEVVESEPIWWAAFSQTWDDRATGKYQTAIREALERAGHFVLPAMPRTGPNRSDALRQMFQPPSVAWAGKLIADRDTPPTVWGEARSVLSRAPQEELVPLLPGLLKGFVGEQDPANRIRAEISIVIRRVGTPAIPAVKAAIKQAPTDAARRGLLQVLSSMGKVGHEEFNQLMQLHPEYGQLLSSNRKAIETGQKSERAINFSVAFRVHVPESTPVDEVLYVTGNHPALGNWNPKGLRLERQVSGEYEAEVHLSNGSRIEYKLTRGSWKTVEKDKNKEELPNRILKVSSDRSVTIRVAQWSDQ